MGDPGESGQKKSSHAGPFKEHMDALFDELSFAFQWQRPSIILITHESEYMQGMVELVLEKRLLQIGRQLVHFDVDEKNFDIPLLLSRRPDRDSSVYSVTALFRGGGKKGANAYRALNIRREYFVDYAIRAIIWLEPDELIELSRHAPDFWAFRHRVISINDPADPEQLLKKGIILARQLNRPGWLAKFWENLGSVYLDTGQPNRSIRAYWKAIRYNPQDAGILGELGRAYLSQGRMEFAGKIFKQALQVNSQNPATWLDLGHLYRRDRRFSDAIIAYQQAIHLDPQNPSACSMLVACYRLSGRDDLADKQSELARPIMKATNEYHQAIFESARGNINQALKLLALASEKRQLMAGGVRRDPSLDLIREDVRSKQFLHPAGMGQAETE